MICQSCHFEYEPTEGFSYCPACDSGIAPVKPEKGVWKKNADALGFTDKRLLDEAPSFQKVGSIFSKK